MIFKTSGHKEIALYMKFSGAPPTDASSYVPQLPNLPPLDALPHTQEWVMMTIDDQDNPARSVDCDTSIQEDNRPSLNAKWTCISFAYKGVRALKAFFLLNLHEELSSKIPDNLFLDGIIISTPRKGKSNTYNIQWNVYPCDRRR